MYRPRGGAGSEASGRDVGFATTDGKSRPRARSTTGRRTWTSIEAKASAESESAALEQPGVVQLTRELKPNWMAQIERLLAQHSDICHADGRQQGAPGLNPHFERQGQRSEGGRAARSESAAYSDK